MKAMPEKQNEKQDGLTDSQTQTREIQPTHAFFDLRPEAAVAVDTQNIADNSHQVVQLFKAADMFAENRPEARMQAMIEAGAEKRTGLPGHLKAGIEALSGHSMDDVTVHYNSDQTAMLNAHAYTKGAEIHLAPGREQHLPHEAWHVAQQKQGRVRPTMQFGRVNLNDDRQLENEAEVMGARANRLGGGGQAGAGDLEPSIRQRTEGRMGENASSGMDGQPLARTSLSADQGVVQRYTIVLARHDKDIDYGPMKVLSTLGANTGRLVYYQDLNNKPTDYTDSVPDNEDINIVGHGMRGAVWLYGHNDKVTDFSVFGGLIKEIVPDGWKRTVKLMTCNASVGEENNTAAGKLKTSLDTAFGGASGITVTGTEGYSYGTPKAGKAGTTSVLKAEYSELYTASATYVTDSVVAMFKGKLGEAIFRKGKWPKKKAKQRKEGAKQWLTEKARIESGIESKYNELSKTYASDSFDIGKVLQAMEEDETFQALLKEQDEHYRKFGFFHEVGEGYS